MNKTIFKQEYKIRSININSNKRLGLYGLIGLLQDTASEHAHTLNFGYETMINQGYFWVLVRQKLKMSAWPKWHDFITIKTWTTPPDGFYATREFEIFLENNKIGECSTSWMALTTKDRKPIEISEIKNNFLPRTDYHLNFKSSKIIATNNLKPQKKIEVKISDLDMNNHVNNIKYSQWVLDCIPFEYHKKYTLKEFEINFLNETFLGDTITLYSNFNENNLNKAIFLGKNEKTSKVTFIVKLKA